MAKHWSRSKMGRTRSEAAMHKRTARDMAEPEKAWLGAFIQADGHAFIRINTSGTPYMVIGISQQDDVEPISTALRITQAGTVTHNRKKRWRETSADYWVWLVNKIADTKAIAEQCAPYSWKLQRVLEEMR